MKVEAMSSPKLRRLARRLGIPRAQAIGTLELLWAFTVGHADRGDVGRWSDEDIAEACDWPVERSGELIEALVGERWLDSCEANRLVVHDWADHAPEYVKRRLARRDDGFADAKSNEINDSAIGQSVSGQCPVNGAPLTGPPNPTQPNPTQPNPGEPRAPEPADDEPNPHPPAEPQPSETRTPAATQHDELTGWVVRRLRQARGGTDEARPPTQGELKRLAALIRPLGGRAIQVVERYADDEHPSTAAKTVRELLGCWDRMRGLVDRPPKRGDEQLAKTLALGRSDGREKPLTDAERQMLEDCACGHQGMRHRGGTGSGACRICECERFTRAKPEPSTSDAGPIDTEPARAAGRSR